MGAFRKVGTYLCVIAQCLFETSTFTPPPCENNIYSIKEALWKGLTTIPRFIPTEDMMGPYWFLSCLFFTSILSWVFFRLGKLFK